MLYIHNHKTETFLDQSAIDSPSFTKFRSNFLQRSAYPPLGSSPEHEIVYRKSSEHVLTKTQNFRVRLILRPDGGGSAYL
jgi:tRNA G37 N-methylase TrmD